MGTGKARCKSWVESTKSGDSSAVIYCKKNGANARSSHNPNCQTNRRIFNDKADEDWSSLFVFQFDYVVFCHCHIFQILIARSVGCISVHKVTGRAVEVSVGRVPLRAKS